MYGLGSFAQLLDTERGVVLHSDVAIVDAPDFSWRGLMVDAGRRFFPMDTLRDLMTTMAANKLNVLHLHASDFCRFGVESVSAAAVCPSHSPGGLSDAERAANRSSSPT